MGNDAPIELPSEPVGDQLEHLCAPGGRRRAYGAYSGRGALDQITASWSTCVLCFAPRSSRYSSQVWSCAGPEPDGPGSYGSRGRLWTRCWVTQRHEGVRGRVFTR